MNDEGFNPLLRYDKMVEKALRSVVRHAVDYVIDNGLPGDHHFYITFITKHEGVDIPDYLVEQYPDEMTIVLQYQFYGLEVDEEKMAVTLSFNNVPERLIVPLDAITIFADPSVNFALQFQPVNDDEIHDNGDEFYEDFGDDDVGLITDKPKLKPTSPDGKEEETGKVISLDNFRKDD